MPSGRTVAPHVLVSGKAETFNVVASAAANDGQTPEIITFNTREEAEEYQQTYRDVADTSVAPGTNSKYV